MRKQWAKPSQTPTFFSDTYPDTAESADTYDMESTCVGCGAHTTGVARVALKTDLSCDEIVIAIFSVPLCESCYTEAKLKQTVVGV